MKVKMGDIVVSEFGSGPIVAMSREWCIHEDEAGNEIAVCWPDVAVQAVPEMELCFSLMDEMDLGESSPEVEHEHGDEAVRIEFSEEQFDIFEEPSDVQSSETPGGAE